MTQEEKNLLIRDLCGRLTYQPFIETGIGERGCVIGVEDTTDGEFVVHIVDDGDDYKCVLNVEQFTVFLRPMSSMTEEEKKELGQEHVKDEKLYAECLTRAANGDNSMRGKVITHFAADWCNKNHFDYRGLIPMGLVLEAPDGMYRNE